MALRERIKVGRLCYLRLPFWSRKDHRQVNNQPVIVLEILKTQKPLTKNVSIHYLVFLVQDMSEEEVFDHELNLLSRSPFRRNKKRRFKQ